MTQFNSLYFDLISILFVKKNLYSLYIQKIKIHFTDVIYNLYRDDNNKPFVYSFYYN